MVKKPIVSRVGTLWAISLRKKKVMGISVVLNDKILTEKAYQNAARFKLFVTLLFIAEQEAREVDGVKLLRGEVLTSLNRLAEQSMLTIKQIRNALSALRKAGYITTVTTHQYTLVKICNYDSYLI